VAPGVAKRREMKWMGRGWCESSLSGERGGMPASPGLAAAMRLSIFPLLCALRFVFAPSVLTGITAHFESNFFISQLCRFPAPFSELFITGELFPFISSEVYPPS